MGGGMERGEGVKDLSGQIGRALNPEGQSIHSAIHYPAIGVTHHESVKVLFPRVQENFPKHFRNVCGHSDGKPPEPEEDVGEGRVEVGSGKEGVVEGVG